MLKKQSGKTKGKTKNKEHATDIRDGHIPQHKGKIPDPHLLGGAILKTSFFCPNDETLSEVGVLKWREVTTTQSGWLVKVQPWDGKYLRGKTVELCLDWFIATDTFWSKQPFDDDVPF